MILLKIIFYVFLSLAGIFFLILIIPKIGNKYLRRKQQEINDGLKKRLHRQIGEPLRFGAALDFNTLQELKKLISSVKIPHADVVSVITQYPNSDLWIHISFSYHDDRVASYALITPEMSRKMLMQLLLVWNAEQQAFTLYASALKDEYTDVLQVKFREELVLLVSAVNQKPE